MPDGQRPMPKNVVQGPGRPSVPLPLLRYSRDAEPYLEDNCLIDDVLPATGLAVLFGAPGSRKTFTALDMGLHISAGTPVWRGRRTERRAVLYLSLEGGRAFKNRLAAWRKHHGVEDALFFRCTERLGLRSNDPDGDRVVAAGRQILAETAMPVGMVVVDTLNRAMLGGNENGVEDMGAFIAICDSIARELECLVLVVHHCGKDAAKGSRGHSSLLGAIGTELSLADGVLTITKQRDGPDGMQFGVELVEVELGVTPKGKRVTSCVATEANLAERGHAKPPLKGNDRIAWEALLEFTADHGKPSPGGTGWPERGRFQIVRKDEFRVFLQGRFTGDNTRQSARRALKNLADRGLIGANDGFLWAIKSLEAGL